MPIKERKIKEESAKALVTGVLYLSHAALPSIPSSVFSLENLTRLDVSFNNIKIVPKEISKLVNLKELWLQNNPISAIPAEIEQCSKLEVMDIRNTNLGDLPATIVMLTKLYEVDWRNTPLEKTLHNNHGINSGDVEGLSKIYSSLHERIAQENILVGIFAGSHFLHESDRPNIDSWIRDLVDDCSRLFTELEDFRLFVRLSITLIPNHVELVTPAALQKAYDTFYKIKAETARKRLSADVEIKLRNIYYDRIERREVENIINSIYEHVLSLEDVQFFVQYASKVLPPNPSDANGEVIWNNILTLQEELTAKREGSVHMLYSCLVNSYQEQEPSLLREKALEIAKYFQKERFATKREINCISQIAAESGKIFPPDFASLDPELIYQFSRKKNVTAKIE